MRNDVMEIDMRKHTEIREQVRAGLLALKTQGRQIWGDDRLALSGVVIRLMVGVGDLARVARTRKTMAELRAEDGVEIPSDLEELKKELGNVVFSTIRWIDDLGLNVLECLDLAIEAQENYAESGRPR